MLNLKFRKLRECHLQLFHRTFISQLVTNMVTLRLYTGWTGTVTILLKIQYYYNYMAIWYNKINTVILMYGYSTNEPKRKYGRMLTSRTDG